MSLDPQSDSQPRNFPEAMPAAKNKPGRPRLGAVGREITLLPRHWEWLGGRRGGDSATLRRLIDQYRSATTGAEKIRLAQDRTNRFIYAIAGNLSNFGEAVRALYGSDLAAFAECMKLWPAVIRRCAKSYSGRAGDSD